MSYISATDLARLKSIETLYNTAKNQQQQWPEATGQLPIVGAGSGPTSSTPLLSETQRRSVRIVEDPEAVDSRRRDREARAEGEVVAEAIQAAAVLVLVALGPPLLLGGALAIGLGKPLLWSLLVSYLAIWGTYLLVFGMTWLLFSTLW